MHVQTVTLIDGNDHVSKYSDSAQCAKGPLVVKYTLRADAGHYEAMVPVRISAISPIPKLTVTKRKTPASSKAQVLTSSPYKEGLEQKRKKTVNPVTELGRQILSHKRAVRFASLPPAVAEEIEKSKRNDSSSREDDDPFCIVCCERFTTSKSRGKWTACVVCHQWAHEKCTSSDDFTFAIIVMISMN